MREHGLTLRVRHAGDQRVPTIKAASLGAGIFERSEWEKTIDGDKPDLTDLGETALGPILTDEVRNGLKPVFETRVERTTYEVVLHVHLEHAAVLGAGGIARLHETRGPVTAEQVREWCAQPDTQITVQPVLDLAEHLHVNLLPGLGPAQAPDPAPRPDLRLPVLLPPRRSLRLRTPRARTKTTGRPAAATRRHVAGDTTAPRPPAAGPMSPSSPASTCGAAPWATSSSKTTTGTLDVTPDPERLRLAREFRAHFGDTGTEP